MEKIKYNKDIENQELAIIETIINNNGYKYMKQWNLNQFKIDYPSLYKTIIETSKQYATFKIISKKLFEQYSLQKEALKLMNNYFRNRGLTRSDKLLFKGIQRYFSKLENNNLLADVGDVVITSKNIKYYRTRYNLYKYV
jgi:hypothetical protein